MTSLNDVICPTLGMICKNVFFKIFLLSCRTTYNHDQLVVKSKSKGLKRQLSRQITEKWLNDARWRGDNSGIWKRARRQKNPYETQRPWRRETDIDDEPNSDKSQRAKTKETDTDVRSDPYEAQRPRRRERDTGDDESKTPSSHIQTLYKCTLT